MRHHQSRAFTIAAILALAGSAYARAQAPAEPPPEADRASAPSAQTVEPFLRVVDGPDGTVGLELAWRVLAPRGGGPGPRIHLVSAVHIADAAFYKAMQERLDALPMVLFEGVKPPGAGALPPGADDAQRAAATKARLGFLKTIAQQASQRSGRLPDSLPALVEATDKRWRSLVAQSLADAWGRPLRLAPAAGEEGGITIASDGPDPKDAADDIEVGVAAPRGGGKAAKESPNLQSQLAKALGLTFQLDAIDSGKPNWHSCDVSMDELKAKLDAAGADDSMLMSMLDGSSILARVAGFLLGMIAQNPQMQATFKFTLIETLGSAEGVLGDAADGAMPGGKGMAAMMRVILHERNDVVLSDLRAVLDRPAADRPSDVAVFYGGGHMPDLQKRICESMGYEPVASETPWTRAITVDPADAGLSPEQAKRMREAMKRMLERQSRRAAPAGGPAK